MLQRKKYIESFQSLLKEKSPRYILLVSDDFVGTIEFLHSLEASDVLTPEETFWQRGDETVAPEGKKYIILDHIVSTSEDIESLMAQYSHEATYIFSGDTVLEHEGVENFILPDVSFREYAENEGQKIEIAKLLSEEMNMKDLEEIFEKYIFSGSRVSHLENPERIEKDFEEKCTVMKQELYKKEYDIFFEFMRTLALNTGNLFKADQLANLLSISRRKVHKYTDILMQNGVIQVIGPWYQDTQIETSRHVKIYFSDLSFLRSLLGNLYFQGQTKHGILENFLFLELRRKLGETHALSFYRKKSGAEIPFVLEDTGSGLFTVIDLMLREAKGPSQALKTFDASYHDRVERYMMMNESSSQKSDLNGTPLLILPYFAL